MISPGFTAALNAIRETVVTAETLVSLSGTLVVFVGSFDNGDNRNPLMECSDDTPGGMQVRKGVTESGVERKVTCKAADEAATVNLTNSSDF